MSEPRFVEATGPDVETAIKNGLARLGAESKDVIVEVLEDSSRGLFGIGGRPARVRLTLLKPPSAPAESKQPSKPKPQQQAKPRQQSSTPRSNSSGPSQQKPRVQAEPKAEPKAEPEVEAEPKAAITPPVEEVAPPVVPEKAAAVVADEPMPEYEGPKTRPVEADDEEARVSKETLAELLTKMDVQANIESYYVEPADENEESQLVLQVTGQDLGTLIGRRGETLAALQYMTRLIVSRELQRRAGVVVDVEQYKARREQRLHSLALRMAKQATQRGSTVRLEPMPAYERRIIHLSLRDRTDVYTQSVGDGDSRKVTIVPVKDR